MNRTPAIACAIAAAVGLLPLPYAYYILLRFLFFGCLLLVGYSIYKKSEDLTPTVLIVGVLALLYNPILPVHFGSKVAWVFVNAGTVFFLWTSASYPERADEA